MLIGIISDSHDNLTNIDWALKYLKQRNIDYLLHAGDACFPPTIKHLVENFPGKIYLVEGNGDLDLKAYAEVIKKHKNFNFYSAVAEIKIDNIKIALTHKPDKIDELANSQKYDLIIYGHTHKPWEKIVINNNKKIHMLNPGTLAGLFAKATFAVYDTEKQMAELILIDQVIKSYAPKN